MIIRLFFSKVKYNFKRSDIILTILLIISIGFGAILVGNFTDTTLQEFGFLFSSDLYAKSNSSFVSNFLSSLGSSAIFSAITILASLSLVGTVGIFAIIALKGLGLGVIFGNLYISHGFKNALIGTCLLLPGAFIATISLIFLATEALRFNIAVFKKIHSSLDKNDMSFLDYIKKIAISGLILIVAALFDSCLAATLTRLFHF